MSFFSKLFGGRNAGDGSGNMAKTSEMLDENLYWKLIQESLDQTNNQDDQEQYLIKRLKKMTLSEIVGFRLRTDKLLYDTYNSEMWCAGYIMNGGCSDDGFEYFRNWVISRGKNVYYSAKNNPDTLIDQVDDDLELYDFESFWYVALEAFQARTGKNLYDSVDEDNFKFKEGHYPPINFTWQEESHESMKAICPKLFGRMWKW